jgi:exoribonuclease-2
MAFRQQSGALTFGGMEQSPVVVNNEVKTFETIVQNSARDVIESFMIAANMVVARYLRQKGAPAIRRIVRQPKRWDRIQAIASTRGAHLPAQPDSKALSAFLASQKTADPLRFPELSLSILKSLGPGEYVVEHPGEEREGHFGLAINDYSHSTAPNRRYADLAMQRIIQSAICGGSAPYDEETLAQIAFRCTERESAARHVERFMKKVAAAVLLSGKIGAQFDAIITGAAQKGIFARLIGFPAEGRVVRGERGLDIGQKIRVRLVGVNVNQGFIDLSAE